MYWFQKISDFTLANVQNDFYYVMSARLYNNGQYATLGRDIDSTEI